MIQRAFDLDPFSLNVRNDLALAHVQARHYESAVGVIQDTIDLFPNEASPHGLLAMLHLYQNQPEPTLRALQKVLQLSSGSSQGAASMSSLLNREKALQGVIRGWLLQLQSNPSGFSNHTTQARMLAFLGEHAQSLDLLEKALTEHEPALVWIGIDPAFDPIRDSSRFRRLASQVLGSLSE